MVVTPLLLFNRLITLKSLPIRGKRQSMRRVEEYRVDFRDEKPVVKSKSDYAIGIIFDILDSVKSAVIVVFFVFALAFRVVGVDGDSMNPTLADGDWLAVTGGYASIERGDIVVVTQPWERNVPIIKRVIAVGGDTVDIDFDNHNVYVNGQLIDEPYILEPTELHYDVTFPVTVDEGCVFVMGDNRNDSLDSRSSKIGMVDERYILGKTLFSIYPFGKIEN